jgi:trans-aconitate 2-methyltransferase
MPNWDPDQYLKFENERTQPSIDLAARIEIEIPRSIIDIGCGPGNSTAILRNRWPKAQFTGLDSSPAMIEKAKRDRRDTNWIVADAPTYHFNEKYDIVFSNAAIQWMPDHTSLIPRLLDIVNSSGALAVQVPANWDSPLHLAVRNVASQGKWSGMIAGVERILSNNTPEFYYDIISSAGTRVSLWTTTYYHILKSHTELVEWYKGTAMRPFLEKLPDDEARSEFEQEVLTRCKATYHAQRDGRLLYPFRRIFFIAYKA